MDEVDSPRQNAQIKIIPIRQPTQLPVFQLLVCVVFSAVLSMIMVAMAQRGRAAFGDCRARLAGIIQ